MAEPLHCVLQPIIETLCDFTASMKVLFLLVIFIFYSPILELIKINSLRPYFVIVISAGVN